MVCSARIKGVGYYKKENKKPRNICRGKKQDLVPAFFVFNQQVTACFYDILNKYIELVYPYFAALKRFYMEHHISVSAHNRLAGITRCYRHENVQALP